MDPKHPMFSDVVKAFFMRQRQRLRQIS